MDKPSRLVHGGTFLSDKHRSACSPHPIGSDVAPICNGPLSRKRPLGRPRFAPFALPGPAWKFRFGRSTIVVLMALGCCSICSRLRM